MPPEQVKIITCTYCTNHQCRPPLFVPHIQPSNISCVLNLQSVSSTHSLRHRLTKQNCIDWLVTSAAFSFCLACLGSCHPFHNTLPGQMEWTSPNPGLPNTLKAKSRLRGTYSQASHCLTFRAPYGEKVDKRHLIPLSFSQTPLSTLLIPSPHIYTLSSFLSVIFFVSLPV